MPRTAQTSLRLASSLFGTIFIAFGINAFVNPASALSFFEITTSPLTPASHTNALNALSAVYGVRDIFMGLVIYAAAYYGDSKTIGIITVLVGAVALADGAICKVFFGNGEWGHWGYTPLVFGVGGALMWG